MSDQKKIADLLRDVEFAQIAAFSHRFNIFDALRISHLEVRHSDFLAFLLTPSQSHNTGDRFLRSFLRNILSLDVELEQAFAVELELGNLHVANVRREWHNIDILILIHAEEHRLAILIENKIGSSEHDDQLARYKEDVKRHYPSYKLVPVFLAFDGPNASDQEYISINYKTVIASLDECFPDSSSAPPDVCVLINHYRKMLQDKSSDSVIRSLCEQVYQRHREALDLIYEYRPDKQAEISNFFKELVEESIQEHKLILDDWGKSIVHFSLQEWDEARFLVSTWTKKLQRILMFSFSNDGQKLTITLFVGPSEDPIREKILASAKEAVKTNSILKIGGHKNWPRLYLIELVNNELYANTELGIFKKQIRTSWQQFLNVDLKNLRAALAPVLEKLNSEVS